ncbi:MAG: hypothetical protein ACYC2K_06345 [Gemmatimonadales bacterium]
MAHDLGAAERVLSEEALRRGGRVLGPDSDGEMEHFRTIARAYTRAAADSRTAMFLRIAGLVSL